MFLERHEQELWDLRSHFSSTSVMDERVELVMAFLESLMERMAADPMLAATNEEQREEARVAVERAVFSQVRPKLLTDYGLTLLHPYGMASSRIVDPRHFLEIGNHLTDPVLTWLCSQILFKDRKKYRYRT